MSKKYKLVFDGQSVIQSDYNGLAVEAAVSEDHVYAELFRLTPGIGSITRGILPYGTSAVIAPNGASGSVLVNPFRAVVGSRVAAATDAVANWQDVKSAISIADGSVSLTTTLSLTANASGNPRWDAVYAAIGIESDSTPTTRKVKNPGSGLVTDESVSVYAHTTVTLGVVDGTPGATPAFPAIPTDTGSSYYILLGYVRVPTGFTAGSTVGLADMNCSGPIVTLSPTTGGGSLRPANQNYVDGATGFSVAGILSQNGFQTWQGTTNQRPAVYVPSNMTGSESIVVAIDIAAASSANWSFRDGDVIDNTRDWRNRICRWNAMVGKGLTASGTFPWTTSFVSSALMFNNGFYTAPTNVLSNMPGYSTGALGGCYASGMGSSFSGLSAGTAAVNDTTGTNSNYLVTFAALGAAAAATPAAGANMPTNIMASGSFMGLYADATTGYLKIRIGSTAPRIVAFIWIDFTAQYPNY